MKRLFNRILAQVRSPACTGDGGFTSYGAKPVNSYSSPPPPLSRPTSGGGGGGNNNDGRSPGSGSGGGKGPDFYCTRQELSKRGHTEDVINCVTQSSILSAWATSVLNNAGRQKHGSGYIQQYPEGSHAFRGKSQPSAEDHKILRFYERQGEAGGRWHASLQEMQRKAELRFNAAAHDTASRKTGFTSAAHNMSRGDVTVAVSVKKFLDLPTLPKYSSEARFTPMIVEVEISRTVSGKQQVYVQEYKQGLNYSNEKGIGDLFSWLKFKPGK